MEVERKAEAVAVAAAEAEEAEKKVNKSCLALNMR